MLASRRATSRRAIGCLTDELLLLARRVYAELVEGDRLIYARDDDKLFAVDPSLAIDIPPHWIAGTYRMGEPLQALVDDLNCLRESRTSVWILEGTSRGAISDV